MAYEQHVRNSQPIRARCAVITLSDTRTPETDKSGKRMRELLEREQHQVSRYQVIRDEPTVLHALLTEGYIEGQIVECPMHGGTFEIATGKPIGAPCTVPLATYPVRVEGDTISIGVSDA